MQDVLKCSLLLIAQRKRQGLFKRSKMLTRGMRIRHYVDHTAIVAQTQRELQAETLLVGKTPACDVALGHARGKVDRAQRTGIAHELPLCAQRRGNGIERIGDHFERTAHDTAHPCLTHAVTYVVDRQNGTRGAPVLELFKVGRGHLLKTVGKLDLAHHGQAVALLKLLGNPRLTEKGNLQHARLVHERDLGHLHTRTGLLLDDTVNRGDDRAHGTDGRHLDGPRASKVQVAMRNMEKEVPHRPNSQTAKGLLTFTRNIFESRDVLVERIALGKTLRDARHGAQLGHGQSLLDREDHGIERLLATMGVDLQIGLSLLDGIDDLLEGLIGQLLTGQNRQRVALLFLLHAVDAVERDLLHIGADHVDGAGDDAHDVTGVNRRAVGGAGVAHGAGDLAAADVGDGLGHGLGTVAKLL